jgi:mono/diheme cytochrome c family protein
MNNSLPNTWFYRLITYRPSYSARIIWGILGILGAIGACAAVGLADLATDALKERDRNFAGRNIEAGARVYFEQCARCHGLEGKGVDGQGPALASFHLMGGPKITNGIAELDAKSGLPASFPSQRLKDLGYGGTIEAYVESVTAGGIPSKSSDDWAVPHPVFSNVYGGPLRPDQVKNVSHYVMNFKLAPLNDDPELIIPKPPGANSGPKPTPVPLSAEEKAGQEVYLGAAGCTGCHAVKGVGAQGGTGPALNKLYVTAQARVASAEYKAAGGKATTPEAYIEESILNPNQFIVPKCPAGPCAAGVMTQNFKDTIKAEDLANLVKWLSTLKS